MMTVAETGGPVIIGDIDVLGLPVEFRYKGRIYTVTGIAPEDLTERDVVGPDNIIYVRRDVVNIDDGFYRLRFRIVMDLPVEIYDAIVQRDILKTVRLTIQRDFMKTAQLTIDAGTRKFMDYCQNPDFDPEEFCDNSVYMKNIKKLYAAI